MRSYRENSCQHLRRDALAGLVLVLLVTSTAAVPILQSSQPGGVAVDDDDVTWNRVWAVEGGRAELACPVQGDTPLLVLWYKGNSTTPVYSYDARVGDGFSEGLRWADENVLGQRAYFLPTRSSALRSSHRDSRDVHPADASRPRVAFKNKHWIDTDSQSFAHGDRYWHSVIKKPLCENRTAPTLFVMKRFVKPKRQTYNSEWEDRGKSVKHRLTSINSKLNISISRTTAMLEKYRRTYKYPSKNLLINATWRVVNRTVSSSKPSSPLIDDDTSFKFPSPQRFTRALLESAPALALVPVAQEDHGLYSCRLDYANSPTTVSYTGLYVAIPPTEVSLYHGGARLRLGSDNKATVAHVRENDTIRLSCRVAGGRPFPTITWSRGSTHIPSTTRYRRWDNYGTHVAASRRNDWPRRNKVTPLQLPSFYKNDSNKFRRETRTVDSYNRWWDQIKVPDPDEKSFNYTNFIQGHVEYTEQYENQYGHYDPNKLYRRPVYSHEPTAEPVQTKPTTFSPQADILSSAHYDKDVAVEADVSLTASRDLLGATLYCRAEQSLPGAPADLLLPVVAAVTLNITLPLLLLEMVGGEQPVSAGSSIQVECRAWGSNPFSQISWWKSGVPLHSSVSAVMKGGNLTTAAVVFDVSSKDNGSVLTCRASNPALRDSILTKARTLNVFYPPEVELRMSQPRNSTSVVEASDLVMVCHAHSHPRPHNYVFYHKGLDLVSGVNDVAVTGATLTLRRVSREQAGPYTCKATNLEGSTLSPALFLTVLFAPVCAPGQGARTQGVALGTTESVTCRVDAVPDTDLHFTWYRLEDTGQVRLLSATPITKGSTSYTTITPLKLDDYGTLMCKARNSIGKQLLGCRVSIVPAGPPDMPLNCTVDPLPEQPQIQAPRRKQQPETEYLVTTSQKSKRDYTESHPNKTPHDFENKSSYLEKFNYGDMFPLVNQKHNFISKRSAEHHGPGVSVNCLEGFHGGLKQFFIIEVYQQKQLKANLTSEFPEWIVTGLEGGKRASLKIMAANARGRSHAKRIDLSIPAVQLPVAGYDQGYIGISLIGAGVGIAVAVLLLLTIAAAVAYHSHSGINKRPPSATTVISAYPVQNNVMPMTAYAGTMSRSGSVSAKTQLCEDKVHFMRSREPDVIRSVGTRKAADIERYPPLMLTPAQTQLNSRSSDSSDDTEDELNLYDPRSSSSTTDMDDLTDLTLSGRKKSAIYNVAKQYDNYSVSLKTIQNNHSAVKKSTQKGNSNVRLNHYHISTVNEIARESTPSKMTNARFVFSDSAIKSLTRSFKSSGNEVSYENVRTFNADRRAASELNLRSLQNIQNKYRETPLLLNSITTMTPLLVNPTINNQMNIIPSIDSSNMALNIHDSHGVTLSGNLLNNTRQHHNPRYVNKPVLNVIDQEHAYQNIHEFPPPSKPPRSTPDLDIHSYGDKHLDTPKEMFHPVSREQWIDLQKLQCQQKIKLDMLNKRLSFEPITESSIDTTYPQCSSEVSAGQQTSVAEIFSSYQIDNVSEASSKKQLVPSLSSHSDNLPKDKTCSDKTRCSNVHQSNSGRNTILLKNIEPIDVSHLKTLSNVPASLNIQSRICNDSQSIISPADEIILSSITSSSIRKNKAESFYGEQKLAVRLEGGITLKERRYSADDLKYFKNNGTGAAGKNENVHYEGPAQTRKLNYINEENVKSHEIGLEKLREVNIEDASTGKRGLSKHSNTSLAHTINNTKTSKGENNIFEEDTAILADTLHASSNVINEIPNGNKALAEIDQIANTRHETVNLQDEFGLGDFMLNPQAYSSPNDFRYSLIIQKQNGFSLCDESNKLNNDNSQLKAERQGNARESSI